MNKPEYFLIYTSWSGHCCFDYSIMRKEKDGTTRMICETFRKEDADLILSALQGADETETNNDNTETD